MIMFTIAKTEPNGEAMKTSVRIVCLALAAIMLLGVLATIIYIIAV